MTTASKRKGSAWELAIAKYLVEQGWKHAERRIAGSTVDKGDIYGIIGCVIEAKNEKRNDFSGYMKELETEIANAKAATGVAIVKRRGYTDVGESYAIMPVKLWVALMKEAGY